VICTDKTGTLTRNQLTVTSVLLPHDSVEVSGSGYEPTGAFLRDGRPRLPESVRGLVRLARASLLCTTPRSMRMPKGTGMAKGTRSKSPS